MRSDPHQKMRMFCPNCGKPVEENGAFCPHCGKAVAQQPVAEKPVETPVQPEPVAEVAPVAAEPQPAAQPQPAVQAPAAEPVAETPVAEPTAPAAPKKRRKIGKWITLGGVAAAVVVAAALVIFNWGRLKGDMVKNFGTPGEYFAYVESESFKETTKGFSTMYGSMTKNLSVTGGQADLSLKVDESILSMISSMAQVDVDWLNEVGVGVGMNMKDQKLEYNLNFVISATEILGIHVILDLENGVAYTGIPDLNPTYIKIDLAASGMSEAEIAELKHALDLMERVLKELPTEEAMNDLLNKYMEIIIGCIDDAELDDVKLKVNGLSQSVTCVTVEVDEELLASICKAVLTEAKDDAQIKDILQVVEDIVAEETGEELDLVSEYVAGIEDFLEMLEQEMEESDNELLFTLKDYVDGSHSVVGRRIIVEEEEVLYYAMVEDGGEFAFTMEVEGEEILCGEGDMDGDAMTGEFVLMEGGEEVYAFEVAGLDLSNLAEGEMKGTLRFKLPEEAMGGSGMGMMGMSSMSFELTFDITLSKAYMKLAFISGKKELFSIEANSEIFEGKDVVIPSDTVKGENEEDMMEWMEGIDTEELMDRLDAVGLTDLIEDMIGDSFESAWDSF